MTLRGKFLAVLNSLLNCRFVVKFAEHMTRFILYQDRKCHNIEIPVYKRIGLTAY